MKEQSLILLKFNFGLLGYSQKGQFRIQVFQLFHLFLYPLFPHFPHSPTSPSPSSHKNCIIRLITSQSLSWNFGGSHRRALALKHVESRLNYQPPQDRAEKRRTPTRRTTTTRAHSARDPSDSKGLKGYRSNRLAATQPFHQSSICAHVNESRLPSAEPPAELS